MPINYSRRGRVGVGWHLASKWRRRPEASGCGGALRAGGGGLVQGGRCRGGLDWATRPIGAGVTSRVSETLIKFISK
jgi:hypothetical protein